MGNRVAIKQRVENNLRKSRPSCGRVFKHVLIFKEMIEIEERKIERHEEVRKYKLVEENILAIIGRKLGCVS